MSTTEQREIRSMHRYAFRSGQWATLVSIVEYGGRECYLVRFPDGHSDWWVVGDPDAEYETRAVSVSGAAEQTE